MMVHLQRQAGAGRHANALDLKARAVVDGVIAAPGAEDLAMGMGFAAPGVVQAGDDVAHVLDSVARGHQYGVRRFHHHRILQPEQRHQAVVGVGIDIAATFGDDIPAQGVARGILGRQLPQRRERTDVAPAGLQRHHRDVGVVFHHGVVNRLGGAGEKCGLVHAHEIAVMTRLLHGGAAGRQDVRALRLQRLQIARGAKQEHAAVPVVLAAGQVLFGGGQIGFLDKGLDARHARFEGRGADVAVAGFGILRHDAEGHQAACCRSRLRQAHGGMEGCRVGDGVIRRQHQQQGVFALGRGQQGG